uniref:Uncharacterized protein n=1 Tax=Arundo donax TaxID=35708 RepID=A0A0A9DH72_ARUDO
MLCCCCSLFLSPSLCWFLWVSSPAYPNLLGTKGFVVVVDLLLVFSWCPNL